MATVTLGITDDALDKYLADLNRRSYHEDEKAGLVDAAHKTVATFSSIVKRKLWLKNGPDAYTDGHEIVAPFNNSHFYQMVEHEIAHNLFQSSFTAKEAFVNEYTQQIIAAVRSSGKDVTAYEASQLAACLGLLANVLEDHRVNSLWGMLYPGSYDILNRYCQKTLSSPATRNKAHDNIITYALLAAYDVNNVPPGRLDRLRPAIVAALKKVERKGPAATFVLCKWLVTQLVSELIRELQGQPPPPDAGQSRVQVDLASKPSKDSDAGSDDSDGDDSESGASTAQDDKDSDSQPKSQGGASKAGDKDGSKPVDGSSWTPPKVDASTADRVSALHTFIQLSSSKTEDTSGENRIKRLVTDVHKERYDSNKKASEEMARAALNTNVNDTQALDLQLYRSEAQMERTVSDIEQALEAVKVEDEDDWITRDVKAKVVFKDVDKKTAPKPKPMGSEDRAAAQRLRNLFMRLEQKKRVALSDAGAEVDVEAYVANKANRTLGPVFKAEGSGRGFKLLILLDRSSSMRGQPSLQVERATRILRTALKGPNVSFNVWGFCSFSGAVNITRIAPNIDVQDSEAMPVFGETPIHLAVRAGLNWLGTGDEKKQLIVLTDGEPVFSGKSHPMSTKAMLDMVQKDCRKARHGGINVTAIGIGNGVDDVKLGHMFGDKRHWCRVGNQTLASTLVRTVSTSFAQHLKNA